MRGGGGNKQTENVLPCTKGQIQDAPDSTEKTNTLRVIREACKWGDHAHPRMGGSTVTLSLLPGLLYDSTQSQQVLTDFLVEFGNQIYNIYMRIQTAKRSQNIFLKKTRWEDLLSNIKICY